MNDKPLIEKQRDLILNARKKGKLAQIGAFCKLSGPGWMQSATTLGGGSLASALYLGVLGGFAFLWLQPFAMILGIVMLAAISYVTLSIGGKPMDALNKRISPILGYGWAIGSMFACFVFAMPQFSLAVASIEQNLAVGFFNSGAINPAAGKIAITAFFFVLSVFMVACYAFGGKGTKVFEIFIKGSVAAIVICFFGVVVKLALSGAIDWGRVWAGFIPDFSVLSKPSRDFMEYISKLDESGAAFWGNMIVGQQRDVVISAAAMAVGINMTFLFPYSMLKKKWDKDFRGLAIFDLATGLFIPFLLATSCIVVAATTQFHAKPAQGLADAHWMVADKNAANGTPVLALSGGKWVPLGEAPGAEKVLVIATKMDATNILPAQNLVKPYIDLLNVRLHSMMGAEFEKLDTVERTRLYNSMDARERTMAAMLVKRDASNLAETLAPLVGEDVARYIFGFGVMGMAMNAILMNMLICGLCFCEVFGKFGNPKWQIAGSMLIFFSACASLFWEGAKMWLVIHAGVIAMILLPIAYGAFMVMMNSKKIMGESAPRGLARSVWNVLMACSVAASSIASLWVLWNKLGIFGILLFALFLAAVVISFFCTKKKATL